MPPVPKKTRPLRAIGLTCGIGSMLVGARQAGFEVVGNIEWRRYYHYRDAEGRNTFTENFPGSVFVESVDDLTPGQMDSFAGADLALGHPECGNFSNLGGPCKNRASRLKDPCDIPLFVDLVASLRPKFFVMDDLPKSFGAYPMEEYVKKLGDYDLFPEWVSNHGYGNPQEYRKRMFMVGSLKEEKWSFIPNEVEHSTTVEDVLGDLVGEWGQGSFPNHDAHEEDSPSGRFINMPKYGDRLTWKEFADYIRTYPEGKGFEYENADGAIKVRIGSCRVRWKGSSPVLHGGNPIMNPVSCYPLTIRERARIQGFPDDFIFYGTKFNEDGLWNHEKNLHMVKQTGKAMPVQFCRYISSLIRSHITGSKIESSGVRLLRPNPDVDNAKKWYCENIGYSNQQSVCNSCWLYNRCSIRLEKYGIGAIPDRLTVKMQPRIVAVHSPVKKREKIVQDKLGPILSPKIYRFGSIDNLKKRKSLPVIHLKKGKIPDDYHCECRFCQKPIGEIVKPDGTYYSRLERREYYDPIENGRSGHIAKTPLHVARWAIQEYTSPGDWVLDPTAGAGTTMVESLVQGRNACGMELEFDKVILANVKKHAIDGVKAVVGIGDARSISDLIDGMGFRLVQNNPPYFGDQSFPSPSKEGYGKEFRHLETTFRYNQDLPNLGLLKEGPEYWDWIRRIYSECMSRLTPGGRFVVAVKDQMRNKKPDQLHEKLSTVLEEIGLIYEGMAFLRHYPGTLHLNTYFKRYGVHPPYYQSIAVFRKEE